MKGLLNMSKVGESPMVEPELKFIGNGKWGSMHSACFYFSYGNVLFIFDYHPVHDYAFCTREMITKIQRSRKIVFVETMRSVEETEKEKFSYRMKIMTVKRAIGSGTMPNIHIFFPGPDRMEFWAHTIEFDKNGDIKTAINECVTDIATIQTNKDPVFLYLRCNVISRIYEKYEQNNFGEAIVWIRSSKNHPFFVYNGLQGLLPALDKYNTPFVTNIVYLDDYVIGIHLEKDKYMQRLSNTLSYLKGPVYLLGIVPERLRTSATVV